MQSAAQIAVGLLPPRAEGVGTLRRIYEEALVRFADRGYHGVSVREIADACGIKASSIYAHVPSKERLLFDLILMGHEEHRDRLRDALLGAGSDPAEQLTAVVAAHVRMHAEFQLLATVANNELHALSPQSRDDAMAIRADGVRMIVDVIERGVRLGRFTCDDPFLAAAAVGAMGIRVAAWYGSERDYRADAHYSVDKIVESYAEFALKLVS